LFESLHGEGSAIGFPLRRIGKRRSSRAGGDWPSAAVSSNDRDADWAVIAKPIAEWPVRGRQQTVRYRWESLRHGHM